MSRIFTALLAVLAAPILAGCVATVQVEPQPEAPPTPAVQAIEPAWPLLGANDVSVRPSLKQWLKEHPEPKVVLRVPYATTSVTAAQSAAGQSPSGGGGAEDAIDYNHAYDVVEKTLFKTGFTVRDRALLSNLLKDEKIQSYKEIKARVDTDLIIEISSLRLNDPQDMLRTKEYRAGSSVGNTDNNNLVQAVARMDGKVVIVESGEVGAILSLRLPICSSRFQCVFNLEQQYGVVPRLGPSGSYVPNPPGQQYFYDIGYRWQRGEGANSVDAATSLLAQQLIDALRN